MMEKGTFVGLQPMCEVEDDIESISDIVRMLTDMIEQLIGLFTQNYVDIWDGSYDR